MIFILSFVSFNNAIGNHKSYLNLKNRNQLHSLAKLTIDLANDIYCMDIKESDCDDCFDFINDSKYSNGNVIEKISAKDDIPKTIIYDFNGNDNIPKIRIIALRGTHTKREWQSNFVFIDKHGKDLGINVDGLFHPGFANSSIKLWNQIEKYIINCKYPVILTGHSRGGSISEILYVIAKEKNPKQKIYCMSYGPLPSMIIYEKERKLTKNIHVFINENDPIPRITMKNLCGIKYPFSSKIGDCLKNSITFLPFGLGEKLFGNKKDCNPMLGNFFKTLSGIIDDSHKKYAKSAVEENLKRIEEEANECIKNPGKCLLSKQVGRVFRLSWVNDKSCLKKSLFKLRLNKVQKNETTKICHMSEINNIKDHKPSFYKQVLHGPVC